MKTKAAVLFDLHKPFEIIELDLDDPKIVLTVRGMGYRWGGA